MNALEIRGLTKRRGDFALQGLDLTLPAGCIMGLIGENGAGKSTTIRLILNALSRDGGTVAVYGKDNRALTPLEREDIGAVLDEVGLPEYMTARQIGRMMAGIFARWQPEVYRDYLRRLALPEDKTFRDFSRGMKMKLGLAAALSQQPKLLLLDEHTAALDPATAEKVLELTRRVVVESHITCLMVTHNMHQALELGNRTLMMADGHIVLDVAGSERAGMGVDDLIARFKAGAGHELDNDRILLSE